MTKNDCLRGPASGSLSVRGFDKLMLCEPELPRAPLAGEIPGGCAATKNPGVTCEATWLGTRTAGLVRSRLVGLWHYEFGCKLGERCSSRSETDAVRKSF